ncbi:MAG: Na/Pi cotransporter family protein [Ruminococcaceae bacterium]|nr:Na/Pi cotransporter family protein [Oscillospiraceae bacterium]
MDVFAILSLIGGLALFLYGMTLMSSSLEKISGNSLEHTLEKITNNKFKSVTLGAAITAVIQSSSATTVMLVGFVSAGVMQLSQAVGVIMGANIGTTFTSWILSLSGIESNNIFVSLLKPTSFSPLLALIGVIMIMMTKRGKKKDIGGIMLGFAILMTGMTMMSDAVKPLSSDPNFTSLLTMFSNPLFGILAGAVFTAIIQSSSASVGVLQVISATGALTFGSAIPIIMGQNIGTCATALISCIGANKNAKRVAFVHLYFNIIGTIAFLILYYLADAIFHFAFADSQITAFQIAIVHSIFNLLTTAILLPFTKQLEKLAIRTVPDRENETTIIPMLDERLLNTPSIAVEQVKKTAARMAVFSRNSLLLALQCMESYTPELDAEITKKEDEIDRFEDVIGSYLVKLSTHDLSERDSNEVSMLLHVIGDFERISDHAVNIMEVSKEMYEKNITFSEDAKEEIRIISAALEEILSLTMRSYVTEDAEMAKHVEPIEQVIDMLKDELRARHIERLRKGNCTIELGFIFSDLLTNYERVSDHCSNIAVALIEIHQFGSFDTHQYLSEVKNTSQNMFETLFQEYHEKYALPTNVQ